MSEAVIRLDVGRPDEVWLAGAFMGVVVPRCNLSELVAVNDGDILGSIRPEPVAVIVRRRRARRVGRGDEVRRDLVVPRDEDP
eukprot:4310930-Heterocapsa_arctica.AAC.1